MPVRYIIVIVTYALAMLGIGVVTMQVAPGAANAVTALIVPAVFAALMLACAALSAAVKQNRTLGMIGIHAALLLPLVCAAGSFSRLGISQAAADTFNDNHDLVLERIAGTETAPGTTVRLAVDDNNHVIASTQAGDRIFQLPAPEIDGAGNEQPAEANAWKKAYSPQGYQTVALASIGVISIFAFFALVTHRPKVPKAPKKDKDKGDLFEPSETAGRDDGE